MMDNLDIVRLVEDNGIELSFTQTERNPFMPGDNSDMDHWLCTLTAPGVETFDFYVSTAGDVRIDDTLAISVLVEDIKTYRGCPGYADFLLIMGLNDDDSRSDVEVAWAEMTRLAPLVEQVVGLADNVRPGIGL